jgi:hypothetical protein
MVFIAIANGAIREEWYGKHLSALHAHQVSTGIGALLFGIYIWVLLRLETYVRWAGDHYRSDVAWDDSHFCIVVWALCGEASLE